MLVVCLLLMGIGAAYGLSLYRSLTDTSTGSLCPPLQVFEDLNGDGFYDQSQETLLGSASNALPGAAVEIRDSAGRLIRRTTVGSCFLPASASGSLTLAILSGPGYTITTSPHSFNTTYAIDTLLYFGVKYTVTPTP